MRWWTTNFALTFLKLWKLSPSRSSKDTIPLSKSWGQHRKRSNARSKKLPKSGWKNIQTFNKCGITTRVLQCTDWQELLDKAWISSADSIMSSVLQSYRQSWKERPEWLTLSLSTWSLLSMSLHNSERTKEGPDALTTKSMANGRALGFNCPLLRPAPTNAWKKLEVSATSSRTPSTEVKKTRVHSTSMDVE